MECLAAEDTTVVMGLITLVGALVTAVCGLVAWLMKRMDKRDEARSLEIQERDRHVSQLILTAQEATANVSKSLDGFSEWEREEVKTHQEIIASQHRLCDTIKTGFDAVSKHFEAAEKHRNRIEKKLP